LRCIELDMVQINLNYDNLKVVLKRIYVHYFQCKNKYK